VVMTVPQDTLFREEEVGVSTVADIVIGLGLRHEGGRMRRVIAVLKARGIPHDTRVRELILREGGIEVV
jgi:KaiC/GvpD/RAD55 family RecA-like ATPase